MIVFDHVSKIYPNGTVGLDDVNLTIQDGEFVAIIGRSGAGKSTLLRAVNRMHDISKGTLTVNDTNVSGLRGKALRHFRREIGMVFQSFNLFNNMTVLENCMVGQIKVLKKDKETARKRAMEYLEKVGMAPYIQAKPRQISIPISSPGDSSSGWPLPGPWPWSRRCCCSTNPPPPWTRRWWEKSSPSCRTWPRRA